MGDVPRPSPGHDEDRVDPDGVVGAGITGKQSFSRAGDPAKAIFVQRHGRLLRRRSRLHFDEGEGPAAASDEVHLADRRPRPRGEYPPALEAKPPGRQPFRLSAAALRLPPIQSLGQRRNVSMVPSA